MARFENQRILVTGACGTVGSELVRHLLSNPAYQPAEVLGLDNDETRLFFLDHEFVDEPRARFLLADIRDRDTVSRSMKGIDIVFHAAALKHVILCERSPAQAVNTNIQGLQVIIESAIQHHVGRVIFTSSDKAVNPTSVMGTTKLMGERLITAANSQKLGGGPIFSSTRFGNILGSNGSVVPIFHRQIADGGPVTLTDAGMTRFVMTVGDAVELVLESAELAQGGEVLITKMPTLRIADLARAMIEELAPQYGHSADQIKLTEIGAKPGEKLYEELMSDEETRRAVELRHYFSILPAFRGIYHEIPYDYPDRSSRVVTRPYISSEETPLTVTEIRALLVNNNLLDPSSLPQRSRYWPGDKEAQEQ